MKIKVFQKRSKILTEVKTLDCRAISINGQIMIEEDQTTEQSCYYLIDGLTKGITLSTVENTNKVNVCLPKKK